MTGTRRDSGRKGGTTTLERYGRAQLAEWGRLGGRPRSLTYDDIRQEQSRGRNNNNEKEVNKGIPGNLGELKRLYKRRGSSAYPETQEAGTTHETPRSESLPERNAVSS